MMNETDPTYSLPLTRPALLYVLAVLNKRPREECNALCLAIEAEMHKQDVERQRQAIPAELLKAINENPAGGEWVAPKPNGVDSPGGQP
jgi:hypothetical protein